MGRHIPGSPTISPINMPGGGGIIAANHVGQMAPKDGTVLTMVSQGLPIDQALQLNPSLRVDMRSFNWVGNLVNANQLLVVWHTSKVKTLEQAKVSETLIGSTGAGSVSVQLPAFYNNVLGTKFKIIMGYQGGQEVDLAMERGEVDGRGTNTYTGYQTSKPQYLSNKLIIPLIQVGMAREAELPDTPLLLDQPVKAEDKPLLEFMSKAITVGRPVATTPGVPAERVAALRKAFMETLEDPEFIAEAKQQNAEVRPMTGQVLEATIRELIEAPQSVRDRVKIALQPKASDTLESAPKR
jgi:tripartite-type tricarboxylate transporter receptor subunit TctC